MKNICLVIPLLLIFFISIGFSALETNLLVDGVDVAVRPVKNIRVTNVENPYGANSGLSVNMDYNIKNINGRISLPNSSSTVQYTVTVTNIGTVDMGILSAVVYVNGNSNILKAEIDSNDYVLGNKLCNTSNVCNGGISKSFDVIISYKSGASVVSGNIDFIVEFDFEEYYTITYNGFSNTNSLSSGVLKNQNKDIIFTSNTGIPSNVTVTGANGSLTNSTLTISNVSGPVTVTRNYLISYSGFTGDVSGLPSSIVYSGGSITFNSTSSIPDSVTVTGATGTLTNSTLVLSNITGNITIAASYASSVTLAYESIQNVYNNPPSSSGSCTYTILPDDSDDLNLRYVGSNPCNYIYFNNSNWRIVGIFDEDGEKLIKIVNPTTYSSNTPFHNKNKKNFENWPLSSLAETLNDTFYQQLVTNGYGNLIKSLKWNVGSPSSNAVTPKTFYDAEVDKKGPSEAYVGLLNVSDVLYATSGPTGGNRTSACLNTNVYASSGTNKWSSSGCISSNAIVNDWLFSGNNEWTVDASEGSAKVYRMQNNGIPLLNTVTGNTSYTRTVVYLKENIKIDSGDGSSNLPYRISLVQ